MRAFALGLNALGAQLGGVHILHGNINVGNLAQEDARRNQRADEDGLGQIERDGRQHGDGEGQHGGLEALAKHKADGVPFVHAPGRHQQHARQRGQRHTGHHRRQQEHGEQQPHRMNNADQAGLPARFDAHAGAGNGGRGRHAAEERNEHVADALPNQLLIGLQPDARHIGGHRPAQQRLDGAQRGNGQRGGNELRQG